MEVIGVLQFKAAAMANWEEKPTEITQELFSFYTNQPSILAGSSKTGRAYVSTCVLKYTEDLPRVQV